MAKRLGILAAVTLTAALAACTNPTAPAAPQQSHVSSMQSAAGGVLMGGDP